MRANRTWFAPTPAMASTTRAYCTSASAGELHRGARDVALVALERLADALPLEALDHLLLRLAEAAGPLAGLLGGRRPYCGRKVLEPDLGRRAEHDRLLDRMLELADVPLPLVSQQGPVRRGRERLRSAAE